MLISIFVLQLFQHRKRRRTLDNGLLGSLAVLGLRARAYIMLGHIRNAQNELIFDLGQQIEVMRTHHLFRLVGHKTISCASCLAATFAILVLVVKTRGMIAMGTVVVEIGFGLDQLQQNLAVHRIGERLIAPLTHHHRIRPHMNAQQRLTMQQPGLAHFSAHGPRHEPGITRRLLGKPVNRARQPHKRYGALRFLARMGECECVDGLDDLSLQFRGPPGVASPHPGWRHTSGGTHPAAVSGNIHVTGGMLPCKNAAKR